MKSGAAFTQLLRSPQTAAGWASSFLKAGIICVCIWSGLSSPVCKELFLTALTGICINRIQQRHKIFVLPADAYTCMQMSECKVPEMHYSVLATVQQIRRACIPGITGCLDIIVQRAEWPSYTIKKLLVTFSCVTASALHLSWTASGCSSPSVWSANTDCMLVLGGSLLSSRILSPFVVVTTWLDDLCTSHRVSSEQQKNFLQSLNWRVWALLLLKTILVSQRFQVTSQKLKIRRVKMDLSPAHAVWVTCDLQHTAAQQQRWQIHQNDSWLAQLD